MRIFLLVPSHQRPTQCGRAILSALETATTENVEPIVVIDETDNSNYELALVKAAPVFRVKADCVGDALRAVWRELLPQIGEEDVVAMLADDICFETPGWDLKIENAARENPVSLIYCDDGLQGAKLATHPFMTRRFIRAVGDKLPVGDYKHLYADSELSEIAKRSGAACYLSDVMIRHLHPSVGLSKMDDTYRRHGKHRNADRAEFTRRAATRSALVENVKAARRLSHIS